jgi:hypothetical protein
MLFTVEFSRKSDLSGKFFTKIVTNTTQKVGENNSISRKLTFYISLDNQETKGATMDINVAHFTVIPRQVEITDDNGEVKEVTCNTLMMKRDE